MIYVVRVGIDQAKTGTERFLAGVTYWKRLTLSEALSISRYYEYRIRVHLHRKPIIAEDSRRFQDASIAARKSWTQLTHLSSSDNCLEKETFHPLLMQPMIEAGFSIATYDLYDNKYDRLPYRKAMYNKFLNDIF